MCTAARQGRDRRNGRQHAQPPQVRSARAGGAGAAGQRGSGAAGQRGSGPATAAAASRAQACSQPRRAWQTHSAQVVVAGVLAVELTSAVEAEVATHAVRVGRGALAAGLGREERGAALLAGEADVRRRARVTCTQARTEAHAGRPAGQPAVARALPAAAARPPPPPRRTPGRTAGVCGRPGPDVQDGTPPSKRRSGAEAGRGRQRDRRSGRWCRSPGPPTSSCRESQTPWCGLLSLLNLFLSTPDSGSHELT